MLYQKEPESVRKIADFHRKFEAIHPFADGNGRIGRPLMTMQFIKNDLIWPLIEFEYRKDYLKAMESLDVLEKFLKLSQQESFKIINNSADILNFIQTIPPKWTR